MPERYKILLSAYACEPNKGSEPGVGWHWAMEIAKRGHEVWVLTRVNNQHSIDEYFASHSKPINIHFIYYDLPNFILILKKRVLGVNVYYFFWQVGVLTQAKIRHSNIKFDLIHHITFGVFRHPSFLYKLNIPTVFGPVGGGDQTPSALKESHPIKYKLIEQIRESINCISRVNPVLLRFYDKAALIYTKTDNTKKFIPYKNKTTTFLEIGIDSVEPSQRTYNFQHPTFRILYVGQIIYMKGIDIAIASFKRFQDQTNSETQLFFVGKGEYMDHVKSSIKKLNIEHIVNLIDWMPQHKLKEFYQTSNIFLFPSLHDSSGNVVLEALSYGLPVICLDLGGPGQIVNENCGRVISTKGKTEEEVIQSMSDTILELQQNPTLLKRLSEGAIQRAREFTWEKTVARVYNEIENYMKKQAIKL